MQCLPRNGRVGFSLAEILVAIAIAGVLVGLVTLNFASQRGRSSAKALASLLTEEFRQAQTKAQRDGRPVALVFPSDEGTTGIADGFYQLEGYGTPKLKRVVSFASEVRGVQLMVGVWPVSSPSANVINPAPPTDAIDIDAWLPAELQGDYCFVFLPSGAVQTNDLPSFDGAFHVLVGAGLVESATAAPSGTASVGATSPNYFSPTRVGEPYTVVLEGTGEISWTNGVLGSSGGVEQTRAFDGTEPAGLITLPQSANQDPAFSDIVVTPELDSSAPAGVDAQVQPNEPLTLTVTATDADGDELFCRWTSPTGHFSSPIETRMVWDEATRTRRSVWTWQPPHDAVAGDPFTLTCTVRDQNGAVAAPIVGSVINGLTQEEGKLFYLRTSGAFQIPYTCKPDGSAERMLNNGGEIYWREVHTALDSSRIIYSAKANGTGKYQIESANVDGSNVQVVLALPEDLVWPRINPQGTHIIFNRNQELWMIKADGTGLQQMTTPSWGANQYVSWSPDGSRIAWIRAQRAVVTMDLDVANGFAPIPASETEVLPDTGSRYHYVEWSPNATDPRLLVNGNVGNNTTQAVAFHLRPDGSNRIDLPTFPNTSGVAALCCWSPDGSRIVYGDRDKVYIIDATDTTGAGRRQILDGPVNFPVWVQ